MVRDPSIVSPSLTGCSSLLVAAPGPALCSTMPRSLVSGSCLFGYVVRPSLCTVHVARRRRQSRRPMVQYTPLVGGMGRTRRSMLLRRWRWVGLSARGPGGQAWYFNRAELPTPSSVSYDVHINAQPRARNRTETTFTALLLRRKYLLWRCVLCSHKNTTPDPRRTSKRRPSRRERQQRQSEGT